MADRRDGYSRRGGDRAHYDDRDRRRVQDRDRARGGDRDHGRGRDRDRDHRRYRSRSKDRTDRQRSRSPGRERGHDRRDGDRHREHRRRDEDRGRPHGSAGRRAQGGFERPERDVPRRDNDRKASTTTDSPRHSASPRRVFEKDSDEHTLPTRSKPSSTSNPTPAAPVSFKVKSRDNSHPPDHHHPPTHETLTADDHESYHDDEDRHHPHHQPSRGRFDAEPMDEDEEEIEVEDDGLDDMAAMMGFGGFGTTKNKKVLGNNVGGTRKEKKTEYRQYMNRQGGFNRPLSPSR